jgi:hypothetical protein
MNLVANTSRELEAIISQKAETLLSEVKQMPQVKCQEESFFGPNIYVKQVTMPAGAVIIGKYHKIDHLCNMVSGRMILVDSNGDKKEIAAPATFIAPKGRKVAYILETVVFQNIFSTDETDLEKLENMIVDNSDSLLEGN